MTGGMRAQVVVVGGGPVGMVGASEGMRDAHPGRRSGDPCLTTAQGDAAARPDGALAGRRGHPGGFMNAGKRGSRTSVSSLFLLRPARTSSQQQRGPAPGKERP